ncbi:fumarylacetoacetate hydrolase family protein [Bordetella genomosp. 13]|uniref:fumarylacetoacetate hydrolase family protein n=1 Tax=Bordetella genomosp. 13 TaxID=463040 RepID=UPI0011A5C794|nr:fumarylacetoacetate hydrolase family protein [Bordetella genomosp. 13]
MKIARLEHDGQAVWGIVADESVELLPGARNYGDALAAGASAAKRTALPIAGVRWLPPVLPDTKIICAGLNYGKHVQEMGRSDAAHASVFPRFADSFVGHGDDVVCPKNSDQLDYEAELAVVIGKTARHVPVERALEYVGGYTCMAENSVRDFQMHNRQATPGKNFERSGALGPWIVPADALPDPREVRVIGRLNGDEMQNGGLDDLIYSIPVLISYLSAFTTLRAGDIIATGTPEGVGMTRKPPRYLRPGDRFEVEVTGVGVLRHGTRQEA